MADGFDTLGTRILQAARMAVAMHLDQVTASHGLSSGQRVVIGRAGPQVAEARDALAMDCSTDGALPVASRDRAGR
jgi:hypothetical protein